MFFLIWNGWSTGGANCSYSLKTWGFYLKLSYSEDKRWPFSIITYLQGYFIRTWECLEFEPSHGEIHIQILHRPSRKISHLLELYQRWPLLSADWCNNYNITVYLRVQNIRRHKPSTATAKTRRIPSMMLA